MTKQPRSVMPDAVKNNVAYLFKNCSYLRLTYEIRAMALLARNKKLTFVLVVPTSCEFSKQLQQFIENGLVEIKRVT